MSSRPCPGWEAGAAVTAADGWPGPNVSPSFTFRPPAGIRISPEYSCVSVLRLRCPSFPLSDAEIKCSVTRACAHMKTCCGALSGSLFTDVFKKSKRHNHKCDHLQTPPKNDAAGLHKHWMMLIRLSAFHIVSTITTKSLSLILT